MECASFQLNDEAINAYREPAVLTIAEALKCEKNDCVSVKGSVKSVS